ncbi:MULTISPECIES: hypothetical protein [Streptomyces]|uniref:hypothetical protein n=1 Tax=Streptomyces TaxID=1883 RepID=UPI00048A9D5B|nr:MULTISPECIES: hypothetical protein [Streptomyces]MYR74764.1 hypothetical protein [Streptomyces sp. SID4925]MYY15504.1 hypothetical protein [Streptomyces sp. SID4912]SBU90263.1 hypothetical protein YUMDRAFT_00990 [Streptomyces sp. OspMP-M45]SCD66936.1 hypothetical protein GA0115241_105186 [Streptomyces sp. DpondAA-D4]SCE01710.1 hypothetical protein GA0115249_112136 [Streptomyces sp. PpalLS-921]
MAKRAVRRRARKVLGEDPVAVVWCEVAKPIPVPPKDVHRAAGNGRLKSRHHWLLYVMGTLFFFVVVPLLLIDKMTRLLEPRRTPRRSRSSSAPSDSRDEPGGGIFDGDWHLAAGQALLRWYGHSPSPKRLVLLTRDRVCVAASPRRRLSPTRADDFRIVAEYPCTEVRVEGEADQPRGFATFRLRFADGSWLEVGRLAEPDDADHFLRTIGG